MPFVHPRDAKADWFYDTEEKTQPLAPPPPLPRPLAEVLDGKNGNKWATNGWFTVALTDLGTFHVYRLGGWLYCASNIKDDLNEYLKERYQTNLQIDFTGYIDSEYQYDVKAPMWVETECPFAS